MNYLVYQAYNNRDFLNECLYSLYTLIRYTDNFQVIIYTDNKEYIKRFSPSGLHIKYRELNRKEITEWRGENGFVHRFKIMILKDLMENIEGENNILYIDTDTTFNEPLMKIYDQIEKGKLFMHEDEGSIRGQIKENIIFAKTMKYRNSKNRYSKLIPFDQRMWNAGVLGFKSSDINLLNEVLEITDKIYSEFQKHIVEQLAFSIIFSREKERELECLDKQIYHYWNFKEFRIILNDFFSDDRSKKELKAKYENINPERLIRPKIEYENLPFIPKQLKKLVGKWKMPDYEI